MSPSCASRRLFGARWAGRAALIGAIAIGALAAAPGVASALTITVNSIADTVAEDAACTLREAITSAASDTESGDEVGGVPECIAGLGLDTIEFSIAGSGPHVISPLSALPTLTNASSIDGLANNSDLIEIDGSLAGAGVTGLLLGTGVDNVRGLSVYGFSLQGIALSTGTGATIEDSFIGTDSSGTPAIGNGSNGIHNASVDNVVIRRNVISGNGTSAGGGHGIFIAGTTTDGAVITDNKIGTNPLGTAALPNSRSGIFLSSPGDNHQIGGAAAADANLISGNANDGIKMIGANTDSSINNTIEGNLIGTNAAGTTAIPNLFSGVVLDSNVKDSTVTDNVISGNSRSGLELIRSGIDAPTANTIADNAIGVGANGTTPIGNGRDGVSLSDGATQNTIGGTAAGDGNVIANNGAADTGLDDGVAVPDATTVDNPILGNSIHSNGDLAADLGIDLGVSGVAPNDPGDGDAGANGLQNYPVLSSAVTGGSTTVSGTLDTTAGSYRLEFFSNPAPDTSGNGEGQTFLGAATVSVAGTGAEPFSETVSGTAPAADAVTATATRLDGAAPEDTSEFSASVTAAPAPPEPLDTTAPIITLAGKKAQRSAKKVSVKVTLDEDATLAAKGNIKVPKVKGAGSSSVSIAAKKKKFKLKGTGADAQASTTLTLKLKLTNKAKKKTKAALKKGKTSTAKVTITATDAAGNESSAKRKIKVKSKK